MKEKDEKWLPVVGYEDLYNVSDFGRVKALESKLPHYKSGTMIRKQKFLKPWSKNGYRIVGLSINRKMKTYSVHRVVAIAFIPNPNNFPEVNHIDGDKSNNAVYNLEWCDRTHNHNHAMATGLIVMPKGENHGMSKLTDKEVIQIRELYKSNPPSYRKPYSCEKISKMFGVSKPVIAKIVKEKSWKHLIV